MTNISDKYADTAALFTSVSQLQSNWFLTCQKRYEILVHMFLIDPLTSMNLVAQLALIAIYNHVLFNHLKKNNIKFNPLAIP